MISSAETSAADAGAFDGPGDLAGGTGSVGHWGHVHQRRNRYRADLSVAPRDGAWKITELEILEESRL